MPGADTILICVDDTPMSENAFKWYLENLHKPQSVVIIYHCVEPPKRTITENIFGKKISFTEYEKQMSLKKSQGKQLVEKYQQKLNEFKITGKVVLEVTASSIPDEILKVAKAEKAILIVMGTKGRGEYKKKYLGSVNSFILHHSKIPVAICNESP